MVNKIKNNKELFRQFFPLLLIISIQQLVALSVDLVDNIMLGSYSEEALTGAALVNQIQFMLLQIISGIGGGVAILGSQYWGKKQINSIKRISVVGIIFAFTVGLFFLLITNLFPRNVLSFFTTNNNNILEGIKYLKFTSWTYLFFSLTTVMTFMLRSVNTVFIGTIMAISTILVKVFFNYCLIFGNIGFPELGIQGGGISTLISRLLELLIVLSYLFFIDRKLNFKIKDFLKIDIIYLKDFIKVVLPMMITGVLWGGAQATQTAILGHSSSNALAANSIASVIFQLFVVFGFSCANTSALVMGRTVGSGKIHLIKDYAQLLQFIFLCIGTFTGLCLFLGKEAIVNFYVVSEDTKVLAIQFLTILSITTAGSCYAYPVESGIIAGGGDTKFAAIVDNSFMWLFTIPLALLSAFIFEWSPLITFILLKTDQILKCIPNFIRCNNYKWVKDLTRQEVIREK